MPSNPSAPAQGGNPNRSSSTAPNPASSNGPSLNSATPGANSHGNRRSSTSSRHQDYNNKFQFQQSNFANTTIPYIQNYGYMYPNGYQYYPSEYGTAPGYMPFPDQTGRQAYPGFYNNQGGYHAHNNNKHMNSYGSNNSSPVAHKSNLHYNNTNTNNHYHHNSNTNSNSHHTSSNRHHNNNESPATAAAGFSSPATSNASLKTLNSPLIANAASLSPAAGKITIKSPEGKDLDLNSLAHKSSPAPSNVSMSPVKPAPKENSVVNDFMARVKAAAAKKKELAEVKESKEAAKVEKPDEKAPKEAPKKIVEEKKSEPKEVKVEEVKAEEVKAEPVKAEEVKAEEVKAEEPRETSKSVIEEKLEETKVEEKPEETEVQEPVEESKVEESKTEESTDKTDSASSEEAKAAVPKESSNEVVSSIEEESSSPKFTVSELVEAIKNAKPIENPFTFKYPEGFRAPDDRCREFFEKTGKHKYDPGFLIQFQEPLKLELDNEWKEKHSSLFTVTEMNPRSNSMRGNSSFRGGAGGFGMGSNIGSGRGPMGGNMRSQSSNLRKGYDNKSGSRQSSKRKGNGSNSGSRRDGRSDSKRNNSKRYNNKDGDKSVEEKKDEKPAEPVVPLAKTAGRWVPKTLKKKAPEEVEKKKNPDGSDYLDEEETTRLTKSLLNKLTLDNFDKITGEIMKIAEQSKFEEDAKTLRLVLELTFMKACDEPYWSSMYAQFCAKMVKDLSNDVKDVSILTKSGAIVSGGALVRKCLLTRCQIEFEKGWSDNLPTNEDGSPLDPEMMSDEYYTAAAAKRRGLGLVKFIGELFALGLLTPVVIISCMVNLTKKIESSGSEDSLETLIQLLNTVGPIFHYNEVYNTETYRINSQKVFEEIDKAIEVHKISARVRFKWMDLLDSRNNNWKDAKQSKGPKTISQIHAEAEAEKQKEDNKRNDKRDKKYGNDYRQSSNNWGQGTVSKNDMRNMGVVRNSSEKSLGPTNNFNNKRNRFNNNLAPTSRENSARSSRSPRSASNSTVTSNVSTNETSKANIFSLLNEGHDESEEEEEEEEEGNDDDEEKTAVDENEQSKAEVEENHVEA